jgi:hypothetical protein
MKAGKGSFAELAKRFAGDLPVRAVLRELLRRHLVELTSKGVRLLQDEQGKAERDAARSLAMAFYPLVSAINANPARKKSVTSSVTTIEIRHPLSLRLLRRHMAMATPAFLESLAIATEGLTKTRAPDASSEMVAVAVTAIFPA